MSLNIIDNKIHPLLETLLKAIDDGAPMEEREQLLAKARQERAQLPHPHSEVFPKTLKKLREGLGLSRGELARRAHIHKVMPRRYEDRECSEFARPIPNTYEALNRALGLFSLYVPGVNEEETPEDEVLLCDASYEQIKADLVRRGEGQVLLSDASLEQIVAALRARNIEPTFAFK